MLYNSKNNILTKDSQKKLTKHRKSIDLVDGVEFALNLKNEESILCE